MRNYNDSVSMLDILTRIRIQKFNDVANQFLYSCMSPFGQILLFEIQTEMCENDAAQMSIH